MPISYTASLGLQKIALQENSGEWGEIINQNFDSIDRRLNGSFSKDLGSDTTYTLLTTDGTPSEGNFQFVTFSGSPSSGVTITISPNDQPKWYYIKNSTSQTLSFTQGSGSNASVAGGRTSIIYADGAGSGAACVNISDDFDLGSTISITGGSITGITDLALGDGGTGASSASAARTALGSATGSDVLAYDANLQSFVSAFTLPTSDGTAGQILTTNASGTLAFANQTVNLSTASGAIAAGEVVALNVNGTVTKVTTSTLANAWYGISSQAIADGATGYIQTRGAINANQSSLTIRSVYYLADNGSLTTSTSSGRKVGKAISATKLLITEGNV
jgi:hypothetical protein